MFLDVLPRFQFCILFGASIGNNCTRCGVNGLFIRERIPICTGISKIWTFAIDIEYGSEGRSYDDALNLRVCSRSL